MIHPDDESVGAIQQAIEKLRANKPNDRSEKDRAYAVAITELEKAYAYAKTFIQAS